MDVGLPPDRNMTLEIRLLSFSTGRPHPLAEQPIIFITTTGQFLGHSFADIQIVGDFLAFLITFKDEQGEVENMFFLVRWKKGESYCVSVSGLQHIPRTIAHTFCSASALRIWDLHIFYFPLRRYPSHSQFGSKCARSNQDCDRK